MLKLSSNIPENEIETLIKQHIYLQLGCYFSKTEDCLSGQLTTSHWIEDYYWNLLSGFHGENIVNILQDSAIYFETKQRKPAFYIDPTSSPEKAAEYLQSKGFILEKEVWMSPSGIQQVPELTNTTIDTITASNAEDFLRVFSIAFGGEATEADGYGNIPPSYLSALRDSISGNRAPGVEHIHLIAYSNKQPVGCGSIHIGERHAGLYNVGTVPTHRKRGVGTAITLYAVKLAKKQGIANIFFQTQLGGAVQRFYENLGCQVIFEAAIAHQE